MEILFCVLGLLIPFVGTTLGASCIYIFKFKGISVNLSKIFNGFAAGVMLSTSFFGLLLPALETNVDYMPPVFVVALGFLLGVALIFAIDHLVPHFHSQGNYEEGIKTRSMSKDKKMFLAVLIHNIPEGLSVGVSFGIALASVSNGGDLYSIMVSSLMLSIGIAIQNIPEGAIVSLPLKNETNSATKAFGYGVVSGAVEPIVAIIGLLVAYFIEPIMPWALALAAGSMVYVTIEDLVPTAVSGEGKNHYGIIAFIVGFLLMMCLEYLLS